MDPLTKEEKQQIKIKVDKLASNMAKKYKEYRDNKSKTKLIDGHKLNINRNIKKKPFKRRLKNKKKRSTILTKRDKIHRKIIKQYEQMKIHNPGYFSSFQYKRW